MRSTLTPGSLPARFLRGILLSLLLCCSVVAQQQLTLVTVVPAAANTSFPDEDGDLPAYIELKANSSTSISGFFLTDQVDKPGKWQIPAGYSLAAGKTIRIFASGKDRKPLGPNGILHTSFAYDCNVPFCGLYSAQLTTVGTFTDRTDRCGCNGVELIGSQAIARTLIPSKDIGSDWTQVGYSDKDWLRGKLGVGYDAGGNPFRDALVLYHSLDRSAILDAVVQDESGPILHPGALIGTPSNPEALIAQGLEFKGDAASHVRVIHHSELDPGQGSFSVALWFKPSRASATAAGTTFTETLIAKQSAPGSNAQPGTGWSIYRTAAGTFAQAVSTTGAKTIALGTSSSAQWHHVVLVINRAQSQVAGFLDGKRIGVSTFTATETFGSPADLFEARDLKDTTPFAGVLDDVAIWGRALTDAQVSDLFSIGKQGKSFLDPGAVPGSGQMYASLIGTDVLAPMQGKATSAYVRVPFHLANLPTLASSLRLRIQYNDGFVAYLNGAEVARRNAPDALAWDSKATVDRPDATGLVSEVIDLSDYLGVLRQGANVLAFQAMTGDRFLDRFLLRPVQLCAGFDREVGAGDCVKETNGRDFWIAFPENYAQEPDSPLTLRVCITGSPGTFGLVDIPSLPFSGFPRSFTLPASGAVTLTLPSALELKGADSIENKAVHITSSANVAVYGTTRMDYTTDSFLGIPIKCLGTEYLVSAYQNVFQGVPILNGTQLAIVAVANNTDVTITPAGAVGSHPGGKPYVISLKKGQTYQLRNEAGSPADLTGTLIVATRPVAVFGSHRCANVQSVNQFFCDTLVEQLLPTSLWGDAFLVAPLATRNGDTVRVLSGADDNLITVASTAGSQSFALQRGQHKDLPLTLATRITARQIVFVTQFSNSSDADHVTASDPFMALIQPVPSWLSEYRICTPAVTEFEGNYVNLVASTLTELNLITLNGVPLGTLLPSDVTKGSFPGGPVFAQVRLKPGASYHIIGRLPIGLTAYGFSEFDSYGYSGGMRFTDTQPPFIGCPPDLVLHCENQPNLAGGAGECLVAAPNLLSVTEFFDDCTPERQLKISQAPPAGTPLKVGKYQIVITATDLAGNTSQCQVSVTVTPPWNDQNFAANILANQELKATVWGPGADPDNDGIPNVIEQATGADPKKINTVLDIVHLSIAQEGGVAFLKVTYKRPANGAPPQLVLEGRRAAAAEWRSGPDIFEELVGETKALGDYEQVSFKALESAGKVAEELYFVRLRTGP